MCGIAGILTTVPAPEDRLRAIDSMTDSLTHRGPDDRGIWISRKEGVALGHRRLSIIDLSEAGHQPMISSSGRYVLVFNGEVYNYTQIREDLASCGISWRGDCDTEVLLEAIDQWGIDTALLRIEGMFAFAVWDRNERTLTLARDRFGEKPLYVGLCKNGSFVFASELKALVQFPEFEKTIDRESLTLFIRHGYIPASKCIFGGVRKLVPGTRMTLNSGMKALPDSIDYWCPFEAFEQGLREPYQGSFEDSLAELDRLVTAAVALRTYADVPVGAFLSGGIDSSLVTAKMQAQSMDKVRTFTIGFSEQEFDESQHARAVADYLGTDHTAIHFNANDCLELVEQLPMVYDEPFSDSSQLPTILLTSVTKQEVAVALSGDGGDELFAGYQHYMWMKSLWGVIGKLPYGARRTLFSSLSEIPESGLRFLLGALGSLLPSRLRGPHGTYRLRRLLRVASEQTLPLAHRRLVSDCREPERFVVNGRDPGDLFSSDWSNYEAADPVQLLSQLDFSQYLPEDLLVKLDRASMFHSLECRVPLLDTNLVEFARRLPTPYKVRGNTGKRILRDLLSRMVPIELIDRPKQGFRVPVSDWLRGPLKEWAADLIDGGRLQHQGLLEPAAVARAWNEHQSGEFNREHRLWSVLMFQCWIDAYG